MHPKPTGSLKHHLQPKSHHTSGSRGIWMSRLKYSMSDAFLKKFLRLERGGKKKHSQGRQRGLAGGRGRHHPPRPHVTCGTARGNGLGGPAACRLADLHRITKCPELEWTHKDHPPPVPASLQQQRGQPGLIWGHKFIHMHLDPSSSKSQGVKARREQDVRGWHGSGMSPPWCRDQGKAAVGTTKYPREAPGAAHCPATES